MWLCVELCFFSEGDVGIIAVEISRAGPTTTVIFFVFLTLGACRNSILGVFGIFLAKELFKSSKFSKGIFSTWPLLSHFVRVLEYI